jgi:hypothetical protein
MSAWRHFRALTSPAGSIAEEHVAGYTLKNLKDDIEDQAPKAGFAPDLEARFPAKDLGLGQIGVSYQRLAPNARAPFGHRHKTHEEVYVVVGGSGRVKLDEEIVDLRAWDTLRVSPETARHFEAGPDGLEIVAAGLPSIVPSDVEPLPGWWSD